MRQVVAGDPGEAGQGRGLAQQQQEGMQEDRLVMLQRVGIAEQPLPAARLLDPCQVLVEVTGVEGDPGELPDLRDLVEIAEGRAVPRRAR